MANFHHPNSTKQERLYVALGGRMGEYQGYGTVWASGYQEAAARFEALMPADRYTAWKANRGKVERPLGDSNMREVDAEGNKTWQLLPATSTYNP